MKRKIVFATISLHKMAGGLERNIVRLSNFLSQNGYDVSLLSFDLPNAESFYPIDSRITWYRLGVTAPHHGIGFIERLTLLKRIRNAVPDKSIIVVFHHGILFRIMAAAIFKNIKIICSERSALSMYDHIVASKWNLNFLLQAMVSKIIVQFEGYKKAYPFLMRDKIMSIPNVVDKADVSAQTAAPSLDKYFHLLAVGRLCDQKNYAILIDAFSKIAMRHPEWILDIVGEGSLRSVLEAQIKNLNLSARIFIHGNKNDIAEWYEKSHLFVMPSKWEGFPNALAEAMAHGLPAVGFKNCDGVSDLIQEGSTGLLADGNGNAITLSKKLDELMGDTALREKMSITAAQYISQFTPTKIYPQWTDLFDRL